MNPNDPQADQWWQKLKASASLSHAIEERASRYPVGQVTVHDHRVAWLRPGWRRALVAASVGCLAFAAWSVDQVQQRQAVAHAVEMTLSSWNQQNTWKSEIDQSLQAAFFVPSDSP